MCLDNYSILRVSSVWPPGLNAFESIVIYDRNAQLFQSFLGQLKKNIRVPGKTRQDGKNPVKLN